MEFGLVSLIDGDSVAVEMYLEFACCAAVPGGGRNKEYALHLLHMCHGNIHVSMNSYCSLEVVTESVGWKMVHAQWLKGKRFLNSVTFWDVMLCSLILVN
jgi:hypothetical protein